MIAFFVFVLGAVVASFVGVLVYRLPKNLSIIAPQSYCESCLKPIKPYFNIPIIGYLITGGRCSNCQNKIPFIYLILEILCALVFITSYAFYGLTISALLIALSISMLIALSAIDIQTMHAPDSINFLALLFAVLGSYFNGDFLTLIYTVQSALVLAGAFALLRFFISYIKKQEALGEADIIVVATLGALLGTTNAFSAIFIASVVALPFALYLRYKNIHRLPFIPFLTIGGIIAMVIL